MITIFTIPKAFQGHIDVIQRNAIQSWCMLEPKCEIMLCGNDRGVKEVSNEYGIMHLPNIDVNEYGTPLLNSAFDQARLSAKNSLLCYVNADIIFLSGLTKSISRIKFKEFLMVGQRWNIDLKEQLNFENKDWETNLVKYVMSNGTQASPAGIDYFIFPREGGIGNIPPFAVGRPCWDNWFIQHTRKLKCPVIDATKAVMAIHQNHGYEHVKDARDDSWDGPEADQNRALMGKINTYFTILDATHFIFRNYVIRSFTYKYLKHRIIRTKQHVSETLAYRKTIKYLLNLLY